MDLAALPAHVREQLDALPADVRAQMIADIDAETARDLTQLSIDMPGWEDHAGRLAELLRVVPRHDRPWREFLIELATLARTPVQ